jgi:purine-binding chemotaxis protein CheW
VLTEEDLVEGALQARFQGFSPTPDGRFATWRPDSGPSPIEPDGRGFVEPAPPRRRPPEPPPAEAPPAAPPEPFDPLDTFFYRPDEEEALVPALGTAAEEPAARPPERLDEFLTFRIGQEEFAVPIERVREVLKAPNITEVPRAPAHVLGVVTVRGEVVAVVDARGRLGLESASGSGGGGRIVIVDAGEGALGLLVDAVASVVRLPRGAIEPCPQGISAAASDCVTGIGRWRDRLFMVVDVATLLGRRPAGER